MPQGEAQAHIARGVHHLEGDAIRQDDVGQRRRGRAVAGHAAAGGEDGVGASGRPAPGEPAQALVFALIVNPRSIDVPSASGQPDESDAATSSMHSPAGRATGLLMVMAQPGPRSRACRRSSGSDWAIGVGLGEGVGSETGWARAWGLETGLGLGSGLGTGWASGSDSGRSGRSARPPPPRRWPETCPPGGDAVGGRPVGLDLLRALGRDHADAVVDLDGLRAHHFPGQQGRGARPGCLPGRPRTSGRPGASCPR